MRRKAPHAVIFAAFGGEPFSSKGAGFLRSIIANTLARPRNPGSLGGVLAVGFADTAGLTEARRYLIGKSFHAGFYLLTDAFFSVPVQRIGANGRLCLQSRQAE